MHVRTVEALERLAVRLDNDTPCVIRRMQQVDAILLQLPWLARKFTRPELAQLIHWIMLITSHAGKVEEERKLMLADIAPRRTVTKVDEVMRRAGEDIGRKAGLMRQVKRNRQIAKMMAKKMEEVMKKNRAAVNL